MYESMQDKNKRISAYVEKTNYFKFCKICKIFGVSANKQLNMLIAEFVFKNNSLLSESENNIKIL